MSIFGESVSSRSDSNASNGERVNDVDDTTASDGVALDAVAVSLGDPNRCGVVGLSARECGTNVLDGVSSNGVGISVQDNDRYTSNVVLSDQVVIKVKIAKAAVGFVVVDKDGGVRSTNGGNDVVSDLVESVGRGGYGLVVQMNASDEMVLCDSGEIKN